MEVPETYLTDRDYQTVMAILDKEVVTNRELEYVKDKVTEKWIEAEKKVQIDRAMIMDYFAQYVAYYLAEHLRPSDGADSPPG